MKDICYEIDWNTQDADPSSISQFCRVEEDSTLTFGLIQGENESIYLSKVFYGKLASSYEEAVNYHLYTLERDNPEYAKKIFHMLMEAGIKYPLEVKPTVRCFEAPEKFVINRTDRTDTTDCAEFIEDMCVEIRKSMNKANELLGRFGKELKIEINITSIDKEN